MTEINLRMRLRRIDERIVEVLHSLDYLKSEQRKIEQELEVSEKEVDADSDKK